MAFNLGYMTSTVVIAPWALKIFVSVSLDGSFCYLHAMLENAWQGTTVTSKFTKTHKNVLVLTKTFVINEVILKWF